MVTACKLETRPGENIGSYHVIDGHKVSMRYAGQQQTCGRCHETPQKCKGRGIAKKCEAAGGIRIEFTDYIIGLWKKIGYSPTNEDLPDAESEEVVQVEQFTPAKVPVGDLDNYAGVSIRQFPKETDHGEIIDFVCRNGLPEEQKDDIVIKTNGSVTIRNLDNTVSRTLIEAIHGKFNFGKKLYCNGFIPLTPQKQDTFPGSPKPAPSPHPVDPSATSTGSTANKSASLPDIRFDEENPEFENSSLLNMNQISPGTLARRHSLSLFDRTPPGKSLAAELIGSKTPSLLRTESILNEMRTISEHLSDFGSCLSMSSSDSDSVEDIGASGGFQTLNEKKRNKKKKRKLKLTPGKEQFLKKPNLVDSN